MPLRSTNTEGHDLLLSIRERIEARLHERPAHPAGGVPSRLSGLAEMRELCRLASDSSGNIGSLPPTPPTLRAKVGQLIIRFFQRGLFWYTPQIAAFNGLISRIATLQCDALDALSDDLARLQNELAQERDENESAKGQLARVSQELASQAQCLDEAMAKCSDLVVALRPYGDTERAIAHIRAELTIQSQRTAVLLQELRRSIKEPAMVQGTSIASEISHNADAMWQLFADVFRGTCEDIKNRLRVYLPRLKDDGAGRPRMPILDLGCGRGEFLQLLADEGLEALGVDANRAMVLQCRERLLNVSERDAVAYLREVPDSSLGAVTAIHLLEHLPLDALIDVLGEVVRVLKPGGLAIFETPNPANLMVGSYTFHTDPTHRNPLPSHTLAFLAEARGLSQVEVVPLHPPEESLRINDDGSEAVRWLNERFYGPQDYAVFGVRP